MRRKFGHTFTGTVAGFREWLRRQRGEIEHYEARRRIA